jgi:hypothetical protein
MMGSLTRTSNANNWLKTLRSIALAFSPLTVSNVTNVPASASSINLLAANATRRDAILHNDSTAKARVKLGAIAAVDSFSFPLDANETVSLSELGVSYTGVIDAIWESATGAMRVTELS